MKFTLPLLLALMLAGCASPRPAAALRSPAARAAEASRFAEAPFVGMTKAQAAARYGKPNRRVLTEQGEQWSYALNRSEVLAKTINPLSLTVPKHRSGILLFDANGKVKRFAWEPAKGR